MFVSGFPASAAYPIPYSAAAGNPETNTERFHGDNSHTTQFTPGRFRRQCLLVFSHIQSYVTIIIKFGTFSHTHKITLSLLAITPCFPIILLSPTLPFPPLQSYAALCLCPWDSPGKNGRVGCHALLQGIFPTQGSNPGLPNYRQIFHCVSHQGNPRVRVKVAGVGSLFLLQGDLPTKELNQGLLHYRRILYQLSYQGRPG